MSEIHEANTSLGRIKHINYSVSAYENGSGGYKQQEKSDKKLGKHELITELKHCDYRTPPKRVALLLTDLFSKNPSRDGHWLYIAQKYTPKTINSVIYQMAKAHSRGDETIKNSSAYFTNVITKWKKPRKKYRTPMVLTNDKSQLGRCSYDH